MIFTVSICNGFPIDETLEAIELLDRSGVHCVLFEDEANYLNVYTLLALVAKQTKNILIGTGVTNPLTRHPVVTASAIASIDQISSGRAVLGLGAGGTSHMVSLGIDVRHPVGNLRIVIPILQRLLSGETVTTSDGTYPMRDISLGILPKRKIPIYIAGRGPRILETGGLLADGVIAGAGLFTPKAMEYARKNIQRGAEMAGRDHKEIDVVAWAYTSVAEDGEKAISAIARFAYITVHSAPIEVWQPTGMDISFVEKIKREPIPESNQIASLIPPSVINQMGLVGTPADCRKKIREMEEAGIDHIGMVLFPVAELGLKRSAEMLVNSVLKEFME